MMAEGVPICLDMERELGHAMTDTSSTPLLSPNLPSEDDVRAQELYQYFKPPNSETSSESGDIEAIWSHPVLVAHSQLVAWRMDTQRGMISLIDRDVQYFVAESTKTLDLKDPSQYENEGDAQWAGVWYVQ